MQVIPSIQTPRLSLQRKPTLHSIPSGPPVQTITFGAHLNPGIKVGVLTTNVGGKHDENTQLLLDEAARQGLNFEVFHPNDVVLQSDEQGLHIWINDKKYDKSPFDVVLPRLGARYVTEGALTILDHLAQMGTHIMNPATALRIAEDKFKTHIAFSKNHVPQPDTLYYPGSLTHMTVNQLKEMGGDDIFIKPNAYTSGSKNVALLSQPTLEMVKQYQITQGRRAFLETAEDSITGQNKEPTDILVQRSLAKGTSIKDYRYMVIDGKILWATAKEEISRYAHYDILPPEADLSLAALKAMEAVGLKCATVDMVRDPHGKVRVLELNPSPGLDEDEVGPILDAVTDYANKTAVKHSLLLFA